MKKEKITQFNRGAFIIKKDLVTEEKELRLFVNNTFESIIVCSDEALTELIHGYLYTERFINRASDITDIKLAQEGSFYVVSVVTKKSKNFHSNTGKIEIHPKELFGLMDELLSRSEIFKLTGGTHISGISNGEKLINAFEDISRRSSVQKAIGKIIMQEDFRNAKILFTSGRINRKTVEYGKRLGIKIIVSRSAVTDRAINLSKDNNITLIGFLRGNRFNIYTHPERIKI